MVTVMTPSLTAPVRSLEEYLDELLTELDAEPSYSTKIESLKERIAVVEAEITYRRGVTG